MDRQEIRFRILYALYQKHYSEDLGRPQNTDKIIEESGLERLNKNEIYGDVVYLADKQLIKGTHVLGYAHPPWIVITSHGIDFLENVISQSIETLEKTNLADKIKTEIKEISHETSPSLMIRKMVEYAQSHGEPWQNIIKIAKDRFYN